MLLFIADNLLLSMNNVADLLKDEEHCFKRLGNAAVIRTLLLFFGIQDGVGNRKSDETPMILARVMTSVGCARIIVRAPVHEAKRFDMDVKVMKGDDNTKELKIRLDAIKSKFDSIADDHTLE
ncbi:hypothetical protein PAEPH01_2129 [Pancytospora epiphaga]|nr:hypothetical protein PAEPH01_2129 [Pancytospora epiphaga]